MRRTRRVALALVVLLLAGCSEIPTVGAVQPGITEAPNGLSVVYVPNPPAQGASQQEIVNGFITAASAGGRFTVAKQYLTKAFAARWKPKRSVLVQQTQSSITQTSAADLVVTVPLEAEVTADGVYTPTTGSRSLSFHLTQSGGQWRIDSAPDGIVLSPTVFQRNYAPRALQFFDPEWKRLVPDRRWFANGSDTATESRIVDALIAGPAGPVSGGVTANALHGAALVSLDPGTGGFTSVSLRFPTDPSKDALSRIQQQLIQTLQPPTPSSLRLFVNGRVVQPVTSLPNETLQPLTFVITGSRFGTLSANGTFTESTTLGKRIMATHPDAVTVSTRQGLAAVRTDSGDIVIVSPSAAARTVDTRPSQIAPTLDQNGWVYSIPSAAPDGLRASNAKGQSHDLLADLPGAQVTSIEASPDGTRMLVLLQKPNGSAEAFVYGILRSPDGTPTGLTDDRYSVDLGGNTGAAIGATWMDSSEVAVLVSAPDGSTDRVQVQSLGGLASALGNIPSATAIVGTSSAEDLRLLLKPGDVYVWRDPNWQEESTSAPEVSVLAVQR